jgi:DNA-binding NarL/FixJ family response regulator
MEFASKPHVRALLADDHVLFGESLSALLAAEAPEIAIDYVDSIEGVKSASDSYDLLLVDLYMPGIRGPQDISDLRRTHGKARIVVLSGSTRRKDVELSISLGLDGYLPKTIGASSLVGAIRLIITGERFFPVSLLSDEVGKGPAPSKFSQRELEVLRLLCKGASNKKIGSVLNVEEPAIKAVVRGLTLKFGAANRTEVVIRALEHGGFLEDN